MGYGGEVGGDYLRGSISWLSFSFPLPLLRGFFWLLGVDLGEVEGGGKGKANLGRICLW